MQGDVAVPVRGPEHLDGGPWMERPSGASDNRNTAPRIKLSTSNEFFQSATRCDAPPE
jgi:hypothetical protein